MKPQNNEIIMKCVKQTEQLLCKFKQVNFYSPWERFFLQGFSLTELYSPLPHPPAQEHPDNSLQLCMRWQPVFNHIAHNYQAATQWNLYPLRFFI